MTKPGKMRGRFLLIAGIAVLAGSLSVTSAAAAPQATVAVHPEAPAANHVVFPSYYVTPAGKRLSVAEFHAEATTQAAAGSLPVFLITSSDYGYLDGIHSCRLVGNPYYDVQGVECADLYADSPKSGVVAVLPAGEGYCQSAAYYPQCANVTFKSEVANTLSPGDTITAVSGPVYCGHTHGACATDAPNMFTGNSKISTTGCNRTPGEGNEFWTVVLPGTTIELPGDVNVSATSNLASQHAIVCP
jgi:hypothetical protein